MQHAWQYIRSQRIGLGLPGTALLCVLSLAEEQAIILNGILKSLSKLRLL